MKTKKRLILAISSFSLVFISVIVAVVAIFAAQRQGVQSQFRVHYVAKDVALTVRANTYFSSMATAMTTDDGDDKIVLTPAGTNGGSLSPENSNIALDLENNIVVFEYIFENDSNTVDAAISLDTNGLNSNNMFLEYSYAYENLSDADVKDLTYSETFEPMMILGLNDEDGNYSTLYLYVKVSIANLANDAEIYGSISFSMETANPVKLQFTDASNMLCSDRYIPEGTSINALPIPNPRNQSSYQSMFFYDDQGGLPVEYPFTVEGVETLTLYSRNAFYSKKTEIKGEDLIITITAQNADILISTRDVAEFSYNSQTYSNNNNEYLMVENGHKITIRESLTEQRNLNAPSVKLCFNEPEDLASRKFYAAYGEYPQAYVGDTLNTILENSTLTKTGKTYNFYHYGDAKTAEEYLYNGKKYVKYGKFYVVEPIVVKSMEKNTDGTYVVKSLESIVSGRFDTDSPVWETSDIRNYLNTEFLSQSGLSSIAVEQTIKNNVEGDFNDGAGTNTLDKVWIPSVEDLYRWISNAQTLPSYVEESMINQTPYSDNNNNARKVAPTDFARYNGAFYSTNTNAGMYFLRNIGKWSNTVSVILSNGTISQDGPSYSAVGICPVFAVNVL